MADQLVVPDVILESIAARPEDVGVWQVLTDFLLENDAPGASLAMCELELMKGISNPDLLGQLADARAHRPKLPHEPWGGYPAVWKCGFVVRLQLNLQSHRGARLADVLRDPAVRGLNMLVLVDDSGRFGAPLYSLPDEPAFKWTVDERVGALLEAAPPFLKRAAIHLEERRGGDVDTSQQSALIKRLINSVPKKLERLDLSMGTLHESAQPHLIDLARRVPMLNLDGTTLPNNAGWIEQLVTAGQRVFLAGTGLPMKEHEGVVKDWLAPDVRAWVERLDTGALVPLTPTTTSEGYEAPAWPRLRATLQRDLFGWSVGGRVLDATAEFNAQGVEVKFTQR